MFVYMCNFFTFCAERTKKHECPVLGFKYHPPLKEPRLL